MRTLISDDSILLYRGMTAEIQDWVLAKSMIPLKKESRIIRATHNAVLIEAGDRAYWIPKSCIRFIAVDKKQVKL